MSPGNASGEDARLRVLIAIDDSEVAVRAAAVAGRMFGRDRGQFFLLNVGRLIPPHTAAPAAAWIAYPMSRADWDAIDTGMTLTELQSVATESGLPDAVTLSDIGDPAERVLDAAEHLDADAVVVGSRQRGFLERLIDPSVSKEVVSKADRPVLVVPEEHEEERGAATG